MLLILSYVRWPNDPRSRNVIEFIFERRKGMRLMQYYTNTLYHRAPGGRMLLIN